MAAEFRQLPDLDIPDYDEALPLGPSDLKHGVLPNGMRYAYHQRGLCKFQHKNCADLAQPGLPDLAHLHLQILCQEMCKASKESCTGFGCQHRVSSREGR